MILGGRGSGKTRAGAEWISGLALGLAPFTDKACGNIALVGETLADVREVMIDGPSGIMATSRLSRPRYEVSRRRVLWDNGAIGSVFSSEDPDSLRGPQFDAAWCDELAKWKYAQDTWDMLQFGLRLGDNPRQIITTTPRSMPLLRELLKDKAMPVTRMKTSDNSQFLATGFMDYMQLRYQGSRLGRQELDGEMIEDRPGALWSRDLLERCFTDKAAELCRIVVAVDPPASSGRNADRCGIVVVGLGRDNIAYVLEDATIEQAKPHQWADKAIKQFHHFEADIILAEVNQGGEMVAAVIHAQDPLVPVRSVRAKRGKWLRAEPIAALYQQGRIRHAGRFMALEDEMCDFGPDGLSSGRSPDRVDALVWALQELLLNEAQEPRIRRLNTN